MAKIATSIEEGATELRAALGLLVRRMRQETSTPESLTWTQVAVMHRLEAGPATIAELARAEQIKPQSMGGSVAILEEQGFVERRADPDDGRQFLIALTPAGIQVRTQSSLAKHAWLTQAIGKLPPRERETLFAAMGALRKLGEQ
jgi:DNA-binding MarR family transcriptional regulator